MSFFHTSSDRLHILSDFDRTLTYGSQGNARTPTLISLLRDGKHLRGDYAQRAHQLYDHYYPMEISETMTLPEKKDAMQEWWRKHFELMIEYGLTKADIADVIETSHLSLREYVPETLRFLAENNIPVIIISAGAIGDAIPMFLEKNGCNFDNISYVCNQFEWDACGNAIAVREPIIHTFNKDETVLKAIPKIFEKIQDRKDVMLLGDSL